MTTDVAQTLRERLSDLKIDDLSFFRAAYYKKYLKEYNCIRDVVAWRNNQTVPDYVQEFL